MSLLREEKEGMNKTIKCLFKIYFNLDNIESSKTCTPHKAPTTKYILNNVQVIYESTEIFKFFPVAYVS